MKSIPKLLSAIIILLLARTSPAATVYWDNNGATAGAGTTSATVVWNTASVWSSSSAGTATPAVWVGGSDAIFSAGADSGAVTWTVNPSAAVAANSVTLNLGT